MSETTIQTVVYKQAGTTNTERTLNLVYQRALQTGINTVLVATSTGQTAVQAVDICNDLHVVAVSHSTGFKSQNTQELTEDNRQLILAKKGEIITCQHAFGGVNRAIRKKFGTYQVDEIIAHTLRLFSQGLKVAIEISLMAADVGVVRTDTPVICVAGSGKGADTAVIIIPANSQNFFDLRIIEIICMPTPEHPVFHK